MTFCIIGGDRRQLELIKLIKEKHGNVKVLGFPKEEIESPFPVLEDCDCIYENLCEDALYGDIIYLPIPYKDKNGFVNMKYSNLRIQWDDILPYIRHGSIVMLGKEDEHICNTAKQHGIHIHDIVNMEEFSITNAIPSAEGAIQIAMENTDITLHGSHCLVLGYGRIGKVLARMLKGIGAYVTVEARKTTDLLWIEENGYKAVHLDNLGEVLGKQQIIFNTIPHLVLDRKMLQLVNRKALIIDLASYPGGVDFQAANEMGIRARLDLGLPGRVAPRTAAEAIMQTSLEIYRNQYKNHIPSLP